MNSLQYNEAVKIITETKKLNELNHYISDENLIVVGLVVRNKKTQKEEDKSVYLHDYENVEISKEAIKSIFINSVRNRIMLLKSKFQKL